MERGCCVPRRHGWPSRHRRQPLDRWERDDLKARYGRKQSCKSSSGVALVRFPNGEVRRAGDALVRGPRRGPAQNESQNGFWTRSHAYEQEIRSNSPCAWPPRATKTLEAWKVYRVLPDPKAAEVGCLRVVDGSGEDYLYPAARFVAVNFPKDVRERLLAAETG